MLLKVSGGFSEDGVLELGPESRPANARDARVEGRIPGWGGSPGGGNDNPLPIILPWKSHEQRSLVATVHGVTKSQT